MMIPELTEDEGQGNIRLPKDWNELDVIARRDLLADWMWHLAYVYRETIVEQQSGRFAVLGVGTPVEYANSLSLDDFGWLPDDYVLPANKPLDTPETKPLSNP